LHSDVYSAKLPTVTPHGCENGRTVLAYDAGDGAGRSRKLEPLTLLIGHADALGDRPGQRAANRQEQRFFTQPAFVPGFELRVGIDDAVQRGKRVRPGHGG